VAAPLVVDGDATGIADAAQVGLLSGNPTILYAGTLDGRPRQLGAAVSSGATLVVTDTNRKSAFEWSTLSGNAGATLTASQAAPKDPKNAPLDIFPGAPPDSQSTAVWQGVQSVTASSYGNDVAYIPENRPALALDGNTDTSWETEAFGRAVGQWWQVTLDSPVTTDRVNLTQPLTGGPNRWITGVTLTFDGGDRIHADLGPESRTAGGQTITFPRRTFTKMRITIDSTNLSGSKTNAGTSAVGFAEVGIPGVHFHELVSVPEDLLTQAGASSLQDRLVFVLDRQRVAPVPPRSDPEASLERQIWLPTARTFSLAATASVSSLIPDDEIDRLMGRPGSDYSGVVAYSSGRLPGDLNDGAASALDGDEGTIWSPGFGARSQQGAWVQVNLPREITFAHLNMSVVADGEHSVPTSVRVTACPTLTKDTHICPTSGPGVESREVSLPPIADGRMRGSTSNVPLSFAPVTGDHVTVTFTGVRDETTEDYYSRSPIALPLGIAELGIPGVQVSPDPSSLPGTCRDDLLSIDGKPIWLEVTGATSAARDGQEMTVSPCGPDASGVHLGAGAHSIVSSYGHQTGWSIDSLTLDSAPGGAAMHEQAGRPLPRVQEPETTAAVKVTSKSATSMHLRVTGATSPFWLVLGESVNSGWTATVGDGTSLGRSELVDGFANGWRIDPSALGSAAKAGSFDVVLRWTPQSKVDIALVVSLVALAACVLLVLFPVRLRRLAARGKLRRKGLPSEDGGAGFEQSFAPGGDYLAEPELVSPFSAAGSSPRWWRVLLAGAAYALVAASLTKPLTGLAVGVAVGTALALGQGRFMLTLTSVGTVIGMAAYVVAHQAGNGFPADGAWPTQFGFANTLAWIGIVFLGADAVMDMVRRGASKGSPGPRARRARRRRLPPM
jgi:hypothetical protein